jgi:GntR family transcriptional regulator/MocR family aminotransferase
VIFRTEEVFPGVSGQEKAIPIVPHSQNDKKPHFPVSVLAKTMRRVISELGDGILEKSPNPGFPQLREAIRQYLQRSRGIGADLDQIIIGSGSEYLYGLTVELLGRDRIYGIESPSYNKIRQVYEAADVRCELLPLGQDGIQSHALAASEADVLHITPYRSFPSGVTASASKRHEYLRWASGAGRYIVEDDFESEFSVSGTPWETIFSNSTHDNVIYLNSFSKTVSPALRVAYMVLPKHLVSEFQKRLGFYSCTVPTFEQFVLAAILSDGDFERHINRIRRQKRREKG